MTDPVSADDVCVPVQDHLEKHLAGFLPRGLAVPSLWRQLPEEEAMSTAAYPAVSVSTSGTVGPFRSTKRDVSATWRVIVAWWVEDYGYDETTSAVRRYVAAGRDCILAAHRYDWVVTGEDYSRIVDPQLALTLGGGRLYLEVERTVIPDLGALVLTPGVALPVVISHESTVSPKE